jgi:tRNA(Ile)-lysidine synthase
MNARGKVSNLAVAHVNHGLRGRESDEDQEFVEGLAQKMGVAAFSRLLGEKLLLENSSEGLESTARIARYNALFQIAHEIGARYLATGHTQDDQVETVLFRVCRGTGIAGLAGIPAIRSTDNGVSIIRPMLGVRRLEVISYLASLGQEARDDGSNRDSDFAARNWIRNELLPLVRAKFGDHVDLSIAQLASIAQEYTQFTSAQAEPLLDRALLSVGPKQVILRLDEFAGQPGLLVQIALQRLWELQLWPQQAMNFERWKSLVRLISDDSPSRPQVDFPGNIRAKRVGAELHLLRFSPVPD